MTTHDLGPPRPTNRPAEPPVDARIDGDRLVRRAVGMLDRDATNALVASKDAAIVDGCCVRLGSVRSTIRTRSCFDGTSTKGYDESFRPVVTLALQASGLPSDVRSAFSPSAAVDLAHDLATWAERVPDLGDGSDEA